MMCIIKAKFLTVINVFQSPLISAINSVLIICLNFEGINKIIEIYLLIYVFVYTFFNVNIRTKLKTMFATWFTRKQ